MSDSELFLEDVIHLNEAERLKLILLCSLLFLLREDARDGLLPEPESVLQVVFHHRQLGVDPEDHVGGGGDGGPGGADVLRLGKVPDPVEGILEVMSHPHVDLLPP